ncbi:BTAD domain-containing putative transcriptional regulator [Pseudonocardia nematodicida]|uniref:BTAD domain-containing putative transcriptional regulator n=1 Tax=Pseudonocardia nematodicida TaxID=1206997 RepID=A0ABV1K5T2_9PSEU
MADVTITAFGPISARVHGEPVELGGPRQRAVLGVLVAAAGRVVSADRFTTDLWSTGAPPHALGSLQAYVSHLRRLLEPDRAPRTPASVLVSAVPGYALRLPPDAVDVWSFDRLVATAARSADPAQVVELVTGALALWTDEPFAAYSGSEWADVEIARLRESRATAVELRAAAALDLDRPRDVLADALLGADPLREPAVALRARALYRAGRQREALAELRALRARLADELGLDPGPALRTLESDILTQSPVLDSPGPLAPAPGRAGAAPGDSGGERGSVGSTGAGGAAGPVDATVPADAAVLADAAGPGGAADPVRPDGAVGSDGAAGPEPPDPRTRLVGRDAELARLAAAAGRGDGQPSVVWVEGEAGTGKSALVEEYARCVDGVRVTRGRCPEATGSPPGWPWQQVLGELAPGDDDPGPSGAFDLAGRVASAVAAHPGVLVVLEDVHRADEETLQVLRQLLGSGRGGGRLLVVATFRSVEGGPELLATLAATTGRTADRIVLGGLDDDAATILLRDLLDRPLPDAAWRELVERAAGHPLFLRQLAGVVALEGPAAVRSLPRALRDLLTRRLEQLPARAVSTLSRAAVLGRDVDVDLLLELSPPRGTDGEEEVIDDLDAAVVAGLLETVPPGELRFTHVLVRDTCYERIPPLRRARMHLAALTALEQRAGDRTFLLAEHAARSLGPATAARALPHLERAARRAGDGGAPAQAAGYWREVLAAHRLGAGTPAGRLAAHRELVAAVAGSGDVVGARREREVSLAAARELGTDTDVARAWPIPGPALWTARPFDPADSAATADEIGRLLDRIDPADLRLRAELLVTRAQEAEPWLLDVALPSTREAGRLADGLGDPLLRCRVLNTRVVQAFTDDDTAELGRCAAELIEAARAADDPDYLALGHLVAASDAVGRADTADRDRNLDAAVRASRTGRLGTMLLATRISRATDAVLRGRIGEARTLFTDVVDRLGAEGEPNTEIIRAWTSATVELAAGDTGVLVERLRAVAAHAHGGVDDLLVTALVDAGRPDEARALWPLPPWPRDATWLAVTALRARNAVALGDRAATAAAHEELLPWSGRLVCTGNGLLVLGPVDLFLARTARVLGDDAGSARFARRAGELAGALGAAHWAARAEELAREPADAEAGER